MVSNPISTNEIKKRFLSSKVNKSSIYYEISFSVTKNYFGALCESLNKSSKTTPVTPVFKVVGTLNISKLRPIFVLPCFSKILERAMYN